MRRPQPQRRRGLAAGFTLLPVVLAMSLIGAIAFMLNRDNGVNANGISSQADLTRARYAAEAGLQAANYAIQAQGCSPPHPTLGLGFSPATIDAGGVSTLTITLSNLYSPKANLTDPLIDTLPGGVVIAATPAVSTTCEGGGAPVAAPGGSTVTLPNGRAIPASDSCTLTVNVTAAAGGAYSNTLPAGALVTNRGNNAVPAVATLTVVPSSSGPPLLGQAFSPATINAGGVSTLTITLSNPTPGLLGAATLNDPLIANLPNGLVIAATPNVDLNGCGGLLGAPPVAVAGSSTMTLPTALLRAIPASGSCTLAVNVTAALGGSYINTLPAGALVTSKGNNAAPAIATLTVVPPAPLPYPIVSSPVTDGNFGGAAYSAHANSTTGSPLTLTSTGSYNGASVTLTRTNAYVYEPGTHTWVSQPGATGKDATVNDDGPKENYGGETLLEINTNKKQLLIEFDLSALPAGSRIVRSFQAGALQPGATISLYQFNSSASNSFSAKLITQRWVEGTRTGSEPTTASPGVTWRKWNAPDSENWPQGNGIGYDPRTLIVVPQPSPKVGWLDIYLTATAVGWTSGAPGPAPTYVSATSFTLAGDQTTNGFEVGRRIKTINSGGTVYSTISSSVFGALTTVTVTNDSGTLDSGLSAVSGLVYPNYGVWLVGTGSTAAYQFRSSEYTTNAALRPKFTATYLLPCGAGAPI